MLNLEKVKEKKNAYIEVEKYKETIFCYENKMQQFLEIDERSKTYMVKCRKLRDILNIV